MGRPGESSSLAPLGADPGLCGRCVHRRRLEGARSSFLRCGLADVDPRFPRYPALPVQECSGFRPDDAETPDFAGS